MGDVQITVATGIYDRTIPLMKEVKVEGIDLIVLGLGVDDIFWRMLRHGEFDVAEMSLAAYCILRSRGNETFIGIPVFPSRMFRHSSIYIANTGKIKRPEDLSGTRIGVPEFQMTAAVWVRGLLSDDFGVPLDSIQWVTGGVDSPGREERIPLSSGVKVLNYKDRALGDLLIEGEIDALICPEMPKAFTLGKIIRLFPDYKVREKEWFERKKILPIMHLVVIKSELCLKFPWIPAGLYMAFRKALDIAFEKMYDTGALRYSLTWLADYVEEERTLFGYGGKGAWSYGLDKNRSALTLFLQYLKEQGLLANPISIEQLFWKSTY